MHDCPKIDVLELYARHSMDEHEWDRIHQHVSQCDSCTSVISDIEKELEVTQTLLPTPGHRANETELNATDSSDQYTIKTLNIPDYKLLKRIGKGGFGEVWIAQPLAGLHCAVKIFPKSILNATEFEGLKTYRNLISGHPNLVQVLHVGETDTHYYYVMELADGYNSSPIFSVDNYEPRSLDKDLHRNGPCGLDQAVEYTRQILAGLKRLHQEELLHRDVKPANLIFVGGILKLADIGLITKEDQRGSNAMTRAYAPPEGIQDRNGDLYCLGKTLFEMITGAQPHSYPTWPDAKNEQQETTFNKLRPLIDRACVENPEDRYPTVDDFSADFEKLVALAKPGWLKRNKRLVMILGLLVSLAAVYAVRDRVIAHNRTIEIEQRNNEIFRLHEEASIYYNKKDYRDAESSYRNILRLDRQNYLAMVNLAITILDIYDGQRDRDGPDPDLLKEAENLCADAKKFIPPDQPQLYLHMYNPLGTAYRKNGNFDLSIKIYNRGIEVVADNPKLKENSNYPMTLENLGIAHIYNGQSIEAESYFLKAANLMGTESPPCQWPWRYLAAIKLHNIDPTCKTALDNAGKCIANDQSCKTNAASAVQCEKEEAKRLLLEARMHLEMEVYFDVQKAKEKINKVLEVTDSKFINSKTNRLLATVALRKGQYQQAYDHAHEAKTLGDNKFINDFIRAIALHHLGSKDAEPIYHQALQDLNESQLASRDYIVELRRGVLWIDSAVQVNKLKEDAEKLLFPAHFTP